MTLNPIDPGVALYPCTKNYMFRLHVFSISMSEEYFKVNFCLKGPKKFTLPLPGYLFVEKGLKGLKTFCCAFNVLKIILIVTFLSLIDKWLPFPSQESFMNLTNPIIIKLQLRIITAIFVARSFDTYSIFSITNKLCFLLNFFTLMIEVEQKNMWGRDNFQVQSFLS